MKRIYIIACTLVVFALFGCSKESKTPQELIIGAWDADYQTTFGARVAVNGGLTFNDCSTPPCPGTDENNAGTTGTITWELNTDGTELTIVDTMSEGGSWNGTHTITTLTETRLTFENSVYKIEMSK